MKQITSFMSEIADEFKIVVVDAIRAMCLKFPQKHRVLMAFLSNVLREEGGFHYKKAIVDTILVIIGKVPEAKEAGLGHLCEFIEDCEFTLLSTQILYLLGRRGAHTTADPAKYIRFIYNRVVLENATVRASAVSALAKFGIQLDYLRDVDHRAAAALPLRQRRRGARPRDLLRRDAQGLESGGGLGGPPRAS